MWDILDWFTDEDNREAALALLTLATALLGGGWFLYDRLFPKNGADVAAMSVSVSGDAGTVQQVAERGVAVVAGAGAVVTVGYTVEQHEERLARREAELRAELAQAHTAEKAALLAQLDEVRRQMADVEASWELRKAELGNAKAQLDAVAAGLPAARLEAAREALDTGDTAKADALFAEVEAMEAAAVERAAAAAFERGKLADSEVRWADAAGHYAAAARLAPSYDHLFAARRMAWRSGNYPAALRSGEDLVTTAIAEHGANSTKHAAALNEHALTFKAMSRYADAEELFRRALVIFKAAPGTALGTYGSLLSNLAELLRDTGRHVEAEKLNREVLEIDERTVGNEHPDYATSLNNLALTLQATGRYADAEALFRQAQEIDGKALGKEHPDYAIDLNNLAGVLRATRRLAEAESLYEEALAISQKALGKDHPVCAIRLSNLAGLRHEMGRLADAEPLYREALAIDESTLGRAHPAYAADLNAFAQLLRAMGKRAEADALYRRLPRKPTSTSE